GGDAVFRNRKRFADRNSMRGRFLGTVAGTFGPRSDHSLPARNYNHFRAAWTVGETLCKALSGDQPENGFTRMRAGGKLDGAVILFEMQGSGMRGCDGGIFLRGKIARTFTRRSG